MSDIKPQIDAQLLRERYKAERDKRINPAGTNQYQFVEGKLSAFADDPFAPPPAPREAVHRELDVLIIGAGFGGIEVAVSLQRQDVNDFLMVDVAAEFGGTWYWNRYPGLRCDVESYIYLPYLEETGYVPKERYVTGSDILDYCRILGRHFGLYGRALFQTRISGMLWDQASSRWVITTTQGDVLRARFVTTQSGIFSRPQLPGIPGIDEFEGVSFHSARWNYRYTGGSDSAGLDGLADQRVGIIGTGATALQVIPEVAKAARQLTVFQRTPTAVGVRDNGPTDLHWFRALPKGWQKARIDAFNRLANGEMVETSIDDGWSRFLMRMINAVAALPESERGPSKIYEAQEIADYEYNEIVRARVDEFVKDPQKAAALKAYYRTFCKRPGFSDDYLPAFARENVKIVDVSTGIERISKRGVVVNGVEHELDCLVFCTGFELGTTWAHQAGYDVIGRAGQKLSRKWADGLVTYHGLFSHGFPNIFFMGLTQTGVTINVPHMLLEQAEHLAFIVKHCLETGTRTVEATADAETEWQDVIAAVAQARRPFLEACTPGYFNAEGQVADRRSAIGTGWYLPSTQFFEMLAAWREAKEFKGLILNGV